MFSQCRVLFLTNLDVFLGSSGEGGKTANAFLIIPPAAAAGRRMFYPSPAERFAAWCGSAIRDAAQSRVILARDGSAAISSGFSHINFLLISSPAARDAEEGTLVPGAH